MDVYNSMIGLVSVELTSADIPGAFARFADAGIELWNVEQKDDLTAVFSVSRLHYRRIRGICEKYGDSIKLLRRTGLYWTWKSLLARPLLMVGVIVLLGLVLVLPGRIFFVEVEGNQKVPAKFILAAAEENGISFGASRRQVRSERVKNALLEAVPQLQWAGVNTDGCVARISVRERTMPEEVPAPDGYGNIVAVRDGVITSCTATRGNLLCNVGQAVTRGEVLISGYTDCGICIRVEQAYGEVYARTIRDLTVYLPSEYLHREQQTEKKYKISLIIGKKRINLWKDSGIQDASCGRMYEEYYIVLPGGFRLPAALAVETYTVWTNTESELDEPSAREIMLPFARAYLLEQMVAGDIRKAETEVTASDGSFRLDGHYVCVEMIASMQREQIGEYDGKTS